MLLCHLYQRKYILSQTYLLQPLRHHLPTSGIHLTALVQLRGLLRMHHTMSLLVRRLEAADIHQILLVVK